VSGTHRECAAGLVSDYFTRPFRGARFDELAGSAPADAITGSDLAAVRALSVGFPPAFFRDLERGDFQRHIRAILAEIPSNAVLEELSSADFDKLLGPDSMAWTAWEDLAASLRGRQSKGTASGCQQAAGRQAATAGAIGGQLCSARAWLPP